MKLAGIQNHPRYGQLARLVPTHEGGYFIGTFGEMPECARAAYLGNLSGKVLAEVWDGQLEALRRYIQPDPRGLGRMAVQGCNILLEKTRHGVLLINPETFSELPVDTGFWERDDKGLYLRGDAV